jgi:hypothetical protein
MLRTRLARTAAVCAMTLGSVVPFVVTQAAPAEAATGQCIDWAVADPTPVHVGPYSTARTVVFKHPGDKVAGTCWWYNNTKEQHWYMEVYLAGGGYGYIWVQRLQHGQNHDCIVDNVDKEKIWYGNYCDLIDFTP